MSQSLRHLSQKQFDKTVFSPAQQLISAKSRLSAASNMSHYNSVASMILDGDLWRRDPQRLVRYKPELKFSSHMLYQMEERGKNAVLGEECEPGPRRHKVMDYAKREGLPDK
jgi:hypothetical protein